MAVYLFKKPLFCLPLYPDNGGGAQVRITFADSSIGATTVDVTLTASTLYNNTRLTATENLFKNLVDAANAAEAAKGGGFAAGTWSVTSTTGPRVQLSRNAGHADDDITNIEFLRTDVAPGSWFGLDNTATPTTQTVGTKATWSTGWPFGLWLPDVYLRRVSRDRTKECQIDASKYDGSDIVVSSGSELNRWKFTLENILAPYVKTELIEDASFVAQVSGLASTETNASWESLILGHQTRRPMRWYPDQDDTSTYKNIAIQDERILSRPAIAAQPINDKPLKFRVTFEAVEV